MRAFIPMNLLPAFYANLNAFNEISKCLFYYPIKRIYTLSFFLSQITMGAEQSRANVKKKLKSIILV